VFATADALARALARAIRVALAANPRLVLGLSAGQTPVPLYRELVRLHAAGRLRLDRATTFNLDEFVGLARSDPRSFDAFLHQHLLDRVRPRRAESLNGAARDPDAECVRYERAIARAGGIDLQLLGLGLNGHVGFNEPAAGLIAATHRVRLTPASRRANAGPFENQVRRVPREALSMGIGTILRARRIVLVATGASKADIVSRLAVSPVTTRVPASLLQLHPNAEIWLDAAAAARL
jgi:glucosamine-6-phosphate deaminase